MPRRARATAGTPRRSTATGLVAGVMLFPLGAWAAEPSAMEPSSTEPSAASAASAATEPAPQLLPWNDPWSQGTPRAFLGAQVDVGFPFVQGRLQGGYGQPHYIWGGVEAGPLASASAVAVFAGLRFRHPLLDVRTDIMYVGSLRYSPLESQDTYERRDVDERNGTKASYLAWDSELEWKIPFGPGALQSETEGMRFPEQDGRFLYLETMRVVAAPEWVARQRLDYEIPLHAVEGLRVAPAAEVVWIPERDDALVWRAGFLVRWWLFHDLELRIDVLPVVASPDSLGNIGGEPVRLALRWKWATD